MKLLVLIFSLVIISCNSEKDNSYNDYKAQTNLVLKESKTYIYEYKFGKPDSLGKLKSEIFYDSSGNAIKLIIYNDDNEIWWQNDYRYDNKENLIEQLYYNSEGILEEKIYFQYDSLNRLIETRRIPTKESYDGAPTFKVGMKKFIYSSKERLIRIEEYRDNRLISIDKFIYDSLGNKIKESHISRHFFPEIDEKITMEKRFVNNNDGKLIESNRDFLGSYVVEKYDEEGNEIEVVYYNEDGGVKYKYISLYNDDNLLIQRTCYDELEEQNSIEKIEYIYY